MTDYDNGANLERQLVDYFEFHGFEAMRSAGSKGIFDVIAIPAKFHIESTLMARLPVAIQAKKTKGNTKKELEALEVRAKLIHANCIWVSKAPKSQLPPKFLIIGNEPRWVEPHEFLKQFYGLNDPTRWYKAIKEQRIMNRDIKNMKKVLKNA